jgi:hypothetical protein
VPHSVSHATGPRRTRNSCASRLAKLPVVLFHALEVTPRIPATPSLNEYDAEMAKAVSKSGY